MGRLKGRNNFTNRTLVTSTPKVKEIKVREPRTRREGEKVPAPQGLPAGWIAEKHTSLAGKTYLRFTSSDGKHKNLNTVSQAIKKDATDKGYAVQPALEAYMKMVQSKEQQKQHVEKVSNTDEQGAVDAFRAKHGFLAHATVANLPGWGLEERTIQKTGQKAWEFKSPEGASFKMLKQVEAALGRHLLAGKEIVGLEDAMKAPCPLPSGKLKRRRKDPRKKGQESAGSKRMNIDNQKKVRKNRPRKKINKSRRPT